MNKQVSQELEQLRQYADGLKNIIQGTNIGTWEWNIQSGETVFNDRWAEIVGYTLEELQPVSIKTWETLAHPDDLAESGEQFRRYISGEIPHYDIEYRIRHKDGHWVWVRDRGQVVTWTDDDKPLLMYGTYTDITDRKHAEEALQNSELRMKALSDSSFESIFISDKGICLDQNQAAERMFGYTSDEAIGQSGTDWIVPEHRDLVMKNMLAGNTEPYEVTAIRKDGTTFPAEIQARMIEYKGRNVRTTALRDITDRKKAEEKLAELHALFQGVIEQSPIPMAIAKPTGELIVNSACEKHLRFTYKLGNKLFDLNRPWNNYNTEGILIPTESMPLAQALKGKTTENLEVRVTWEDKSEIWEIINAAPIHNDDGEIIAGFATFPDITDRKMAEETLRKSESIYRSTIENANGVPYQLDLENGKYVFVGAGIENLIGIVQKEFSPQAYSKIIIERVVTSPGDMGNHTSYGEAFRSGEVKQFRADIRIQTSSGDIKWINDCAVPIHDDAGQVVGSLGILQDITDRKRAEEALRESGEQLWMLVENMGDIISRHLPDTTMTYVSPSCENLLGYKPEELLNTRSAVLIHPEDMENTWAIISGAISQHDDQYRLQHRLRHKNGKYVWIETVGRLLYEPDGSLREIQCNVRDITERKQAGQALKQSEEKFRQLMEQSPLSIQMMTPDGKTIQVNKAWEQLWEVTLEDLHDYNMLEDQQLEQLGLLSSIKRGFAGETLSLPIAKYDPKNIMGIGLERWVRGNIYPVKGDDGTIRNVILMHEDVTEQMKAEQALREKTMMLDNILHSANNIAIATTDLDFRITYYNPMAENLFGYTAAEVIGKTVMEMHITEKVKPDRFEHAMEIVRRTGEYCYSVTQETENGPRYLDSRVTGIFDQKGKLVGYSLFSQNITKRKKTEQALRESEEKFSKAFHNNPAIAGLHDLETGEYVEVNQSFCDTLGFTLDEVIGKKARDIAHLDNSFRKTAIAKLKKQGYLRNEEAVIYAKNGTAVNVLLSAEIIEISNRKYVFTTATDITKRKQAEETNTRLLRAIEQADETIVITDAEGTIQYANPAFEKITGYAVEEAIGQNPKVLKSGQHDDTFYRRMWETLLSGHEWRGELINKKKDGSLFTERTTISPVFDTHGKIVNYVAAKSDITETKRLQALESRAERLETAGTIAGQVAHDFNNLLAPLMAYPELIREELPRNHPTLKFLDQIEKAAEKIAEINQDLLAMGRRGHYNQDVLNLNTIIQHALAELEPLPTTLACETDLSENLMDILGGGAQLHRVTSNLLHNAKDAVQNIGQISIRTQNYYVDEVSVAYGRVPKGEYVKLTISDNGCGIPNDIAQKIFDPFFTTKTTDKRRGSGLGMSVVDAVIRDHNGYIDMSTKPGEGTSFYIYFPITRKSVSGEDVDTTPSGTERILVVDDDDVQREVSCQLLTKLGYKVSCAHSGEKAIEIINEKPQDLLILDMIMPGGMDGTQTYQKVLKIAPDQKTIIVSGFSETDRVIEAQKLGVGAFVQKPLTRKAIGAAVRRELDD